MQFDQIVVFLMAISLLLGAFDAIIGNKFGLGEQFEEGFKMMGQLALGMVGIISLAPVVANILSPLLSPVFESFGADPSIFASILAIDMGGHALAEGLANSTEASLFSGILIASMLGSVLVFSIPVGFGIIKKEDYSSFSKGLIIGLITIPIGGFIGGMIAGFELASVLINLLPVLVLSVLLSAGLIFVQRTLINGMIVFAIILKTITYIALAFGAFEHLTGIVIIPGMTPVMEGLEIIGQAAVVLLGAFPFVTIVTRLLKKPLEAIGRKLAINSTATSGIVISMAHPVPTFNLYKNMDDKGKVINAAIYCPGNFSLGSTSRLYKRGCSKYDHAIASRQVNSRGVSFSPSYLGYSKNVFI